MTSEPTHVSVLPAEVVGLLQPKPREVWVDATLGIGGHSRLLANAVGPEGRVIALDQDAQMLALAVPRLAGLPVTCMQASFDQIREVLTRSGLSGVDGLLADLGICSDQLNNPERGLSFQSDGPLDMRMDQSVGESAAQLLARVNERDLADLIWQYGEERHSRRVARRIVEARHQAPIRTTGQLAELVRRSVPRSPGGIDPATRVFQALRIAVNDELGALDRLLASLPAIIRPGGRVGIISFHSLEDRRVKQALRDSQHWELITRKPVQASEDEVRQNPRSRSAKLRVAKRR